MKLLRKIFISPSEPRLRAGWRLLLQTLLLGAISIVLAFPVVWISSTTSLGLSNLFLNQIMELVAITGSVFLARKVLDRRSIVSIGLKLNRRAWIDLLMGIGITFISIGLIFGAEYVLGWLDFQGFAWQSEAIGSWLPQVLIAFLVFVFVGWNEELLSRGYHLQTLESGLNMFWAVVISSSVFGALHLGNPNATWISAAGIFFAGVFLAYGYIRTKQLWLPIGLHIGWNFFEGVIFGFPVSGLNTYRLIRTTVDGPVLWTGGAFGPEAGLIVLPAILVGCLLIYAYTHKRLEKGGVDSQ